MGAWKLIGLGDDGSVKYEFVRGDSLQKGGIVVMDEEYKVPLALQIDSKTRAFWSKVFYGETQFWVKGWDVKEFEAWVKGLSEEHREKMQFLVARRRS